MTNIPKALFFIVIMLMLGSTSTYLYGLDNAHFYRSTNLFQETRLAIPTFTSLDVSAGYGKTHSSFNTQKEKVPLFDLYGAHNMHDLGVNVPGKSSTNALDLILCQLANTQERTRPIAGCDCSDEQRFAFYSINGTFRIFESNISYIQNAVHGFFAQAYLPVRRIKINNICFNDISPTDSENPNNQTPMWVAFKNNFDAILHRYSLSKSPLDETGVGDLSLLAGWTHNFQETESIDFIDTTLKFGLLVPTGKKRNEDHIFSIPLGYNGHLGVPLSADISCGLYDWVTIQAHIDGMFFANTTRNIRLKTAASQQGIIKLAKGEATISKGAVWTFGLLLKADHIYRGFSALVGYIFAQQRKDTVLPCNRCFDSNAANCDPMLDGWTMQTINFMAEYDFTKDKARMGGRIAAFYSITIDGKQVFKTNMAGGNLGIDINWNF